MSEGTASVETVNMNRCVLYRLWGRFDGDTASIFEEAMNRALDVGRYKIVLNLKDVNYMSSAALRVLISTARESRRPLNGGDVRLAEVSERVADVLNLAGLDDLFESYESEAEAVGSF